MIAGSGWSIVTYIEPCTQVATPPPGHWWKPDTAEMQVTSNQAQTGKNV